MTREQLVADYKAKLAHDAETDDWTASDAAWETLCAWDNEHRTEPTRVQTFTEAMIEWAGTREASCSGRTAGSRRRRG